ncbi:MAG: hypothetical protein OYK82_07715 [Gammaproteobacteria bacterium]|nr:hypothetical protein [Gammaproteobacteria bacterium]
MKGIVAVILNGMSRISLSPTIFADEVRRSDRDAFRKDLEKLGRDFRVAMGNEENRPAKGRVDRNPQ